MGQQTGRARIMTGAGAESSSVESLVRSAFLSVLLGLWFAAPPSLQAQGVLTVTPERTVARVAGTGAVGYTGSGGAASAASLANPRAVAYDGSGDQFIADAQNNVI